MAAPVEDRSAATKVGDGGCKVAAEGPVRVGFLGSGMMAQALVGGILRSGFTDAASITASDPSGACQAALIKLGVSNVGDSNAEVVRRSDVIIIAVKPHVVATVLAEIHDVVDPARHLFVSIAAGVTVASMQKVFASLLHN